MLKRDLYYERIPTKSLRDDVRYLGNILGRVIKKQEGESFFNLVKNYMNEGATILGGCCEIKPSHIKAISELII